jgi:hypothetical protein
VYRVVGTEKKHLLTRIMDVTEEARDSKFCLGRRTGLTSSFRGRSRKEFKNKRGVVFQNFLSHCWLLTSFRIFTAFLGPTDKVKV